MIDRIKEARLLFLKKGIMKREFLRNDIALSWARSQVYSVDPEALNFQKNISLKKLIIDDLLLEKHQMIEAIFVCDSDGKINRIHQNSQDALYRTVNFSETSIGTNGIALAISTQKKSYVSSYEHYHQLFFDKLTYGIPFKSGNENRILGLIINDTTENFIKFQSDLDIFAEKIIDDFEVFDEKKNPPSTNKIDLLFPGKSERMLSFIDTIQELNKSNSNLFLIGENGSGKETLARYIHQRSQRNQKKFFSIYCDKMPTNIMIDEVFNEINASVEFHDTIQFGTIYFEAFEMLSFKSQEVLMRLLDSKLINSKPAKASKLNDCNFIFSSTKSLDEIKAEGGINEKLLNRINAFTIEIPTLLEIRADIPLLLSKKIEKYCKQYYLEEIAFDEDLVSALVSYNWPGNYREFDRIIEEIVYKGRSEKVIDISYLPSKLLPSKREQLRVQPLEITEHNEIIRALELMNYNIASTAKLLGIGRSTLYRKLDKYKINY